MRANPRVLTHAFGFVITSGAAAARGKFDLRIQDGFQFCHFRGLLFALMFDYMVSYLFSFRKGLAQKRGFSIVKTIGPGKIVFLLIIIQSYAKRLI